MSSIPMPNMAKALQKHTTIFLVFFFMFFLDLTAAKPHFFSRSISPASLGLKKEKLTHLHFYFHDIVTGKPPTAVPVAGIRKSNLSVTEFGTVVMMDDPLTEGPELNSKAVGRSQGIYASASQSNVAFLMVLNFAFTEGKYNGSNLSLFGRNAIFSGVREMPIVGGSGVFRFCRGYALAKTHSINLETNNAVVEYNVYVIHYEII